MLERGGAADGLKSCSSKTPGSCGCRLDDLLAMSSASLMVPRCTCCSSRAKNYFSILRTSVRYASMCSSFGSYTLLEKLTRSCESPLMGEALHPQGHRSLEASYEAFILCYVVGDLLALLEAELHGVVELVLSGRDEYCSSPRALAREGTIKIHDPAVRRLASR